MKTQTAASQFIPTLKDVIAMAPKLNVCATMTAKEYGINHAIKHAKDKSTPLPHHGNEIRQIAAMMCVMHLYSTLDRDTKISLQSVYQYLKLPSAIDEISENYASIPPATSLSSARIECQASIDKFKKAYSEIDFRVLGHLQSFRNNFIAHISWSEVGKLLKYNELEALVEIVCRLAGELSLFTSGKNDWPKENKTQIFEETVAYWTAIFSADAADLLNYGPKDMMDIPAQH